MIIQNYLIIEDNIVTNVCLWDGNTNSWQPPHNSITLIQETTPTKVWRLVDDEYVLVDSIGNACIGFTWDGLVAITNESKPDQLVSADQPISSGTQTL